MNEPKKGDIFYFQAKVIHVKYKKDYIEGIPARVVTQFLQEIVIPRIDKIKDETLDLMKDKETEGETKEQVELGNSEPM